MLVRIVKALLFVASVPASTVAFLPSFTTVVTAQSIVCPVAGVPLSSNNSETATLTTSSAGNMATPLWFQKRITITAPSRGCHLITTDIMKAVGSDMQKIHIGMCNIFVQHTSASLTINENADPDVRTDMETALNKLVPALWCRDGTFKHTMEGDDDMPGHVKSSVMGVSLNIPISNGRLALGTWQGVYLNEHRDTGGWGGGHARQIVITLQGQSS